MGCLNLGTTDHHFRLDHSSLRGQPYAMSEVEHHPWPPLTKCQGEPPTPKCGNQKDVTKHRQRSRGGGARPPLAETTDIMVVARETWEQGPHQIIPPRAAA